MVYIITTNGQLEAWGLLKEAVEICGGVTAVAQVEVPKQVAEGKSITSVGRSSTVQTRSAARVWV